MNELSHAAVLRQYPPAANDELRRSIAALLHTRNIRIVVLDDDPTGIQTVHGNYLLTNWKPENIAAALADSTPFFYVLTNTRALSDADAEQTVRQVMNALLEANRPLGYKLVFVSRSDSTLRGHFPLEPDVIRQEIVKQGIPVSLPTVFTPAFFEAGRYTVGGVHYMKEGDRLIPVSETEFARDNVFGYAHAELIEYIREKSGGQITPDDIVHIPLDELRKRSAKELEQAIAESADKKYITLDALDYSDLQKFGYALLQVAARNDGYTLLCTSSSMPKALSGIADRPLLDARTLACGEGGGVFIVGSHVKKTTGQLARLLDLSSVTGVEIDILEALHAPGPLLEKTEEKLLALHRSGQIPVVYTSRQELRLDNAAERQQVGQRISDFLVDLVGNLRFRPAWLVAKGGITSHDILTRGLGIERARVLGQVLPGVPAVVTGKENRFPEMPYIIFPGNVGSEEALREICLRLTD
jgi:uncharacterized protein YgbK (DUF1537 family)